VVKKILVINLDQCIRCYACEIACKQENEVSVGPRWCRVITIGPRRIHKKLVMDFVPTMCFQCDDPVCANFCPTNAIRKGENGIVLIKEDACTGCMSCVIGCPYGAIHFDQKKGKVGKCNLCINRIDGGLDPSCVQHCIGESLQIIAEDELDHIIGNRHKVRIGQVCYTSGKWRLSDV